MMRRWLVGVMAVVAIGLGVGVMSSACGGSPDGPEFPEVVSLGGAEIYPSITNTFLLTGDNRVSIRLIDDDDAPVLGADVALAYYDLNGDEPELETEARARFVPMTLSYVDELSDGATAETGDDGVYVSQATFDAAGDWGVLVTVAHEGKEHDPIPYRFTVVEAEQVDALKPGDQAPATVQQTTATAADISEIDSSSPPRVEMHDVTVAEALETGKPLVVAFATPAFCRTRTCAPVMDTVVDPLFEEYGDRAEFIHIEPYALRDLREANVQTPVAATLEWRIRTEPIVFVVGTDGRIRAVFEGIMAADEVESVLELALAGDGASATP